MHNTASVPSGASLEGRLGRIDWTQVESSLRERPYARTAAVLSARECAGLIALYEDDRLFRSRVDMERHRFGVGDYKYFARPLPRLVQVLRDRLYTPLAAIANRWMEALGEAERYPPRLPAFLRRCAAAGQAQPTPCCSTTKRAATTACTRTSTVPSPSRCRLRSS